MCTHECLSEKTLQNKSAAVSNIPQLPHKGIETTEEIHGNEINLINFHMEKSSPLRILVSVVIVLIFNTCMRIEIAGVCFKNHWSN